MSRLDGRAIRVAVDADGIPVRLGLPGRRVLTVVAVREHWREWFGALDHEPERDVWQLETDGGHVEIHGVRDPFTAAVNPIAGTEIEWILHRWED